MLFHASELNILPTMAAAIAPSATMPVKGIQVFSVLPGVTREICCFISQALLQLVSHIADFAAMKPNMIKPNNAKSLAVVNVV